MLVKLVLIVNTAIVANGDGIRSLLFPVLPVGPIGSNDTLCLEHSELYIKNVKNLSLWAHESKYKVENTLLLFFS